MAAPNNSNFVVLSRFSGPISGAYSGGGTSTLNFHPLQGLRPGDEILVSLTAAIQHTGGGSLSNPASWSFRVRAGTGPADFTQQVLPFGGATDSIAGTQLGDLDSDGDLDIFCGYMTQAGKVWLNQGGGAFGAGPTFGTSGIISRCISVGDLDGDGDPDIVQGTQNDLRTYRYNGTAFIAAQVLLPSANVPNLDLADLDADGDLDVIACKLSAGAEVFFNNGMGTFTAGGSFAGGQIVDVAVADFNGDRRPDIVLTSASTASVVHINNGAGVFTASTMSLGAYTQVYAVCAGDTDGDSDVDVISVASGIAYVFKLNSGAFTETGTLSIGSGDYEPRLADLDGDTDLDLVIAVQQGQSRAFINDGAGNFAAGSLLGPNNNGNISIATGDLDGDNDLDIVFACANMHQSSVLLNGTTSTPTGFNPALVSLNPAPDSTSVASNSNVSATFSGNANGASATTFVVQGVLSGRRGGSYSGSGTPTLAFNPTQDFRAGESVLVTLSSGLSTPAGAFSPPVTYQFRAAANSGPLVFTPPFAFGNPGWAARDIAPGDLDLDGDIDLVLLYEDNPTLVLFNVGAGQFVNGGTFGNGFDDNRSLALGDLDGDGDLDAVIVRGGSLSSGEPNTVYFNNGAGVFGAAANFGPGNDRSRSVSIGDMDGDGDMDIVVGNVGPGSVHLNNGSGVFGAGSSFGSVGGETHELALADFNHDGFLDAVCANMTQSGGAQDYVHLNDGLGALTLPRPLGSLNTLSRHVAASDMDNDGDVDVVMCSGLSVQLWLNNGLASFSAGTNYIVSDDSRPVALCDVDGDGDLDVAVGRHTGSGASVIRNLGGTLGAPISVSAQGAPWNALCAADFDNDGDLDLAFGDQFSSTGAGTIYHELIAAEATLSAGPAAEPTSIGSLQAVPFQMLDFSLADPGINDALPTRVAALRLLLTGSSANGNDGTWTLNGPDATGVVGVVQGSPGSQQVVFTNLSIEVLGATSETYAISLTIAQTALASADNTQLVFSLGVSELTVPPASSSFIAGPAVANAGVQLGMVATRLTVLTQPGASQSPGVGFVVVVGYTDIHGNVDADVQADLLTVTRSDSGVVTQGTATAAAGLASYSGVAEVVLAAPDAFGIHLIFSDDAAGAVDFSASPAQSSSFDLYSNSANSLLLAAPGPEPGSIDSVAGSLAFVQVLDFQIVDSGGDGHATAVTQLEVDLFGSAAAGSDCAWQLNGAGVMGATGVVSGAAGVQKVTFAGISLSVADGASAILTLSMRLNSLALATNDLDGWQIRIYASSCVMALGSTTFAASQPAVGNYPTGVSYSVAATELRITQQPPASVNVNSPFDVRLEYTDVFGNRDAGVTGDVVSVSRSDGQPVPGVNFVAAIAGRALFTGANALVLATPGATALTLTFTDDATGINLSASPVNSQPFDLVVPGGNPGGRGNNEDSEDESCTTSQGNSALVVLAAFSLCAAMARRRRA